VIGERLLAPPAPGVGGNRRGTITPAEEKRLQQGSDVYGAVCFACHAPDGLGEPLGGAPAGTMMAPPLAGSPRLQGHRDYVIKVLLRGMTGPIEGRTYRDVMVPMDNTDEWIAGIASYVRTSFGNNGDLVTPADVARVRAEIAGRKTPWTAAELEASLPRPLDAQQFTLAASHGGATAPGAATLRGWHSGVPQMPGMWFQIELREPALLTEIQFDSPAVETGRGGRGRGAGAPAQAAPPPPPEFLTPRAYDVRVSADGKKWSKPVATGVPTGSHTTIAFPATRAQFVRITQIDNIPGAPAWSIRNLRVYEARTTDDGR
jgi:mono/diheme cytochrome c family protein